MSGHDSASPPAEWVHSLADVADDPRCGGKARGLAKLIAAGQPVPPGIVIDSRAFSAYVGPLLQADRLHEILRSETPPALVDEVRRRCDALLSDDAATALAGGSPRDTRYAVRSSATIEDAVAGAGAGLFSSVTGVASSELGDAIKAVWQSAISASVAAYARRRDASVEIAVIVQPFVEGERITVYTRPPGAPTKDEVLVQRGASLERLPRASAQWIVALALRAEAAIGASDGADVELIQRPRTSPSSPGASPAISYEHHSNGVRTSSVSDRLTAPLVVVQARPIVHTQARSRAPMPPPLLAALVADGRKWTWDVAHNPDPLSTAQAELVDRVDRAGIAPYSLRTVSGFLFAAPRRSLEMLPQAADLDEEPGRTLGLIANLEKRMGEAQGEPANLVTDTSVGLVADLERRMGEALGEPTMFPANDTPAVPLGEAIDRYVSFYKIWSTELSPMISALRKVAARSQRGDTTTITRPSSVEATLLCTARGEISEQEAVARLGVLSPAWDVAVPTYAEQPGVVLNAIARARDVVTAGGQSVAAERISAKSNVTTPDAVEFASSDDIPALAADLAERDDLWFARAQWLVRRTLIARGRELGLDDDDVFWIPFEDLNADIDAESGRRRAAGARAAMARAAKWDPPLVVHGNANMHATSAGDSARELRGVAGGGGGTASGRVVRYASLASAVMATPGDVIVARAITPALAVMVIGCAAIVSETGGLLDHGAAMARELGIPCVVGCQDAWRLLEDGALVEVDGNAGLVRVATIDAKCV